MFLNKYNPIISLCNKIHSVYIKVLDPDLFNHLEKNQIEPQIYGLRWIRLLFAREFKFQHLFILWDGIFAHSEHMSLIGWIAVAVLLEPTNRNQILSSSFNETMAILMRPQGAIPCSEYITNAINYKSQYEQILKRRQALIHPNTNTAHLSRTSSLNPQLEPNHDLILRLAKIYECLDSIDSSTEISQIHQQVQKAKHGLKFVIDTNSSNVPATAKHKDAFFDPVNRHSTVTPVSSEKVLDQVKAGFFGIIGMLEETFPKTIELTSSQSFENLNEFPKTRSEGLDSRTSVLNHAGTERGGFVYPPPASTKFIDTIEIEDNP